MLGVQQQPPPLLWGGDGFPYLLICCCFCVLSQPPHPTHSLLLQPHELEEDRECQLTPASPDTPEPRSPTAASLRVLGFTASSAVITAEPASPTSLQQMSMCSLGSRSYYRSAENKLGLHGAAFGTGSGLISYDVPSMHATGDRSSFPQPAQAPKASKPPSRAANGGFSLPPSHRSLR